MAMNGYDLGLSDEVIYRAGQLAPPGRYARIDRPDVVITLAKGDHLPASLDGTVALYTPIIRVGDLVKS